jgi:ADP-ribose pyrophosphatase
VEYKNFRVVSDLLSIDEAKETEYVYIEKMSGVTILPILPDNRIVLLKQFRYLCDKECWELPGGRANSNENLAYSAQRELKEETGYDADEILPLFDTFSSPGISKEKVYIFCAKGLHSGKTNLEATESDVIVGFFTYDECMSKITNGEIVSAVDALAIAYMYIKEGKK